MNTPNTRWNYLNILLIAYAFFVIPLYCTNFSKPGFWNTVLGTKTSIVKSQGIYCIVELCLIMLPRLLHSTSKVQISMLCVFVLVSVYRIFGLNINIPGWAQWSNCIFLALIAIFFLKEKEDRDTQKEPKEADSTKTFT